MSIGAIPASEIVRSAEAAVRRAFELRAEADAIEAEARARAVEALGGELGAAAMDMARLTASSRTPDHSLEAAKATTAPQSAVGEEAPASAPPSSSLPAAAAAPAAPDPVPERHEPQPQPSVPDLCGVDVPPSRLQEAEEIVSQAESLYVQGRKSNPYASDRGKNAWRKALFRAAWEKLATAGQNGPSPSRKEPAAETPPAPVVQAVVSAAQIRAAVPGDMEDLDAEEEAQDEAAVLSAEDVSDDEAPLLEMEEVDAAQASDDDDQADSDDGMTDSVNPAPSEAAEVPGEAAADADVEDKAATASESLDSGAVSDPLDDLDELPPPSPLPPPRGYATVAAARPAPAAIAAAKPVSAPPPAAPKHAPAPPSPPPAYMAPPPRPASPAPAPVSPRPPLPAVRQEPPKPAYPLHTPIPVPPNRRPGNGQVLQRPSPPREQPSSPGARPAPAPPRFAPPSFTR